MKVLMVNIRPNAAELWGGDTTQVFETQRSLVALGVSVDVLGKDEPLDLASYDLIHLFNLQTAENGLDLLNRAVAGRKPVALSSIYWDLRYARHPDNLRYGDSAFWSRFALSFPRMATGLQRLRFLPGSVRRRRAQACLLRRADLILPNSVAELEILIAQFGYPELRARATVVPNAVIVPAVPEAAPIGRMAGLPDRYVLMVAAFHPIKGQARLIEALLDNRDLPIVFVGRTEGQSRYLAHCQQLAKQHGNVIFAGERARAEMPLFYRRAAVHALPSLRESPGLASLEAAVYGANIVVGIHAPVQEYFDHAAFVCDPLNLHSVRDAVLRAWESPRSDKLPAKLLAQFTWDRAAEQTLLGYRQMLHRLGRDAGGTLSPGPKPRPSVTRERTETMSRSW